MLKVVLFIKLKKNLSLLKWKVFLVTIQLEFLPRAEIPSVISPMVLYPAPSCKILTSKNSLIFPEIILLLDRVSYLFSQHSWTSSPSPSPGRVPFASNCHFMQCIPLVPRDGKLFLAIQQRGNVSVIHFLHPLHYIKYIWPYHLHEIF